MNKEDKITFEDLANWLDKPLSNNDIDLINFILTSIENRYKHVELQQKLNQLETNIEEAISIIQNDTTLNPERQRKRLIEMLKRGKE